MTLEDSIVRYDGLDFFDVIAFSDTLSLINKISHFVDSQNRHWLSTIKYIYDDITMDFMSKSTIYTIENGIWSSITTDARVGEFYEFQPNEITVNTGNAVGQVRNGQILLDTVSQMYPSLPLDLNILYMESLETVWLESGFQIQDYGLYQLEQNNITQFGVNSDFLSWVLYDIVKDCDENLMVSSPHRIQTYRNNQWETISRNPENENCLLYTFIEKPNNCENWIEGLSDDCFSIWQIQEDSLIESEILPLEMRSLTFDPMGNIYGVARPDRTGLLVKVGPDGSSISYPIPLSPSRNTACEYTNSGSVFVVAFSNSGEGHKIYEFHDEIFTEHNIEQFGDINIAQWVYEDSNGHIWFATRETLLEYDGISWTEHNLNIDNRYNYINDILEDDLGNLWIATREEGLIYYDGNNTTAYTTANSDLLNTECLGLVITNNEYLWIRHGNGLTRMTLDEEKTDNEDPSFTLTAPSLFPNPSLGQINLINPEGEERKYEIIDLNGKAILKEVTSSTKWQANLKPGVYLVKISNESGQAVEKLVVF